MSKLKDLTGMKFGRLTVIERAENDKHGRARWLCLCDCGNKKVIRGMHLTSGHTVSCGCFYKENFKKVSLNCKYIKHGMRHNSIYYKWQGMKDRCFNPKNRCYHLYGKRGVTVYSEWVDDFQAFYDYVSKLEHFGEEGYTLDRIDPNGNYEPNNIRWADAKTQTRNKRNNVIVEYNGESMTLKDSAEKSGINYHTLYNRYKRGWTLERLFDKP